jgi:hypothetical protein
MEIPDSVEETSEVPDGRDGGHSHLALRVTKVHVIAELVFQVLKLRHALLQGWKIPRKFKSRRFCEN